MYLLIMEDGSVFKMKEYSKDDLIACDDGFMSMINISDVGDPKIYIDGKWDSVDNAFD